MAFDGSGTFNLPESPFVYDTVISETAVNSNFSDIATGLSTCLTKNGQTNPTANLPMNSKKFTGMAVGSAATDSATLGQVQAQAYIWCGTAGGTADAITLSPSPVITAYAAGQTFRWKAGSSANTGAMTVAISGLTTIAAQSGLAALAAGDHAANAIYEGTLDTTSTIQIRRIALGFTDPMTTRGDILVRNSSNATARLATGAANTVLLSDGTDPAYAKVPVAALADGTDGELITWDASGNPATVAAGTAGQVLTSNGAGAAPTMQDATGGLVYIASATASTSASLDFDSPFDGTSDEYILKLTNLRPETDQTALILRLTDDSGATFEAANYQFDTLWRNTGSGGAGTQETSSSASGITMTAPSSSAGAMGNAAAEGGDFEIKFHQPSGTGFNKRVNFEGTYKSTAGSLTTIDGSGCFDGNTSAITGFQILMSSGNIVTCTARLYRIVNS